MTGTGGVPLDWSKPYLLRAGWLYDPVAREVVANAWLVIEKGNVAQRGLGESADIGLPVFDLSRHLVTPGLIDSHCHLMLPGDGLAPESYIGATDATFFAAVATANLLKAATCGVTAVCDLGSPTTLLLDLKAHLEQPTRAVTAQGASPRDLIEQQRLGIHYQAASAFVSSLRAPLPRVLAAGAPITPTAGHMDYFGGTADTPDQMLRVARRQRASGAEILKVVGNGGGTRYSRPWVPYYGAAELEPLVQEAHAYGQVATIHANHVSAIEAAIESGFDGIEHCSFMVGPGSTVVDLRLVQLMAERGVWVTPTFLPQHRTIELALSGEHASSLPGAKWLDERVRYHEAAVDVAASLWRAGVPLLVGTDAGWRAAGFDSFLVAMELLGKAGLSFEELLYASTLGVARARGVAGRMGSLAIGSAADLAAFAWDRPYPPNEVPKAAEWSLVGGRPIYRSRTAPAP